MPLLLAHCANLRERAAADCGGKLALDSHIMDIDLIDVIADEGYSASNLKRPGLQAALTMLRSGKACTLIVVKLDRLTRCLKEAAGSLPESCVSLRR